jgi:hypothetical protein
VQSFLRSILPEYFSFFTRSALAFFLSAARLVCRSISHWSSGDHGSVLAFRFLGLLAIAGETIVAEDSLSARLVTLFAMSPLSVDVNLDLFCISDHQEKIWHWYPSNDHQCVSTDG